MRKKYLAFVLGLVFTAQTQSQSTDLNYEPPPPASDIEVLCVTCRNKFDTETHEATLKNLVNSSYNKQLRKALYWQDMTVFQLQSKAHFDNCDFRGSLAYIQQLISETDDLVGAAENASKAKRETAILDSFFKLGQALHAIQDFYAHTNYLELQAKKVKELSKAEKIEVWTPEGAEKVKAMSAKGLISGYVSWGYPKKCTKGSESHAGLAKDSSSKGKGAKDSGFNGYTYHAAASAMARESSVRFLKFAFSRWPALREANGDYVALEIMEDHRQHEDSAKP